MYYNISYGGNTLEEINTDFRHKVDDLIDKIREESNEGLNIFNSEVLVGIIESLDRPIQTKEDVAKLICECVSCENCPVLLCSTDPYHVSSDGKLKHNVKSAGDTSVELDNVEQRYCIKRLEDWITGGKPKTPINEPKTIKEPQFD